MVISELNLVFVLTLSSGDLNHITTKTMIVIIIVATTAITIKSVFAKSSMTARTINLVSSIPYSARQTRMDHGKKSNITVERAKNSQKFNFRYGFESLSYETIKKF